jgi:hypothetical protein
MRMSGFGDVWVTLAYGLTIGSVLLCVVYGIINWNKPKEDLGTEVKEEAEWENRDPEYTEGGAK